MRILCTGLVPARYEVHDASREEIAKVIEAVQTLELEYEIGDFSADAPELVVIALTEVKADQFDTRFWQSIMRSASDR